MLLTLGYCMNYMMLLVVVTGLAPVKTSPKSETSNAWTKPINKTAARSADRVQLQAAADRVGRHACGPADRDLCRDWAFLWKALFLTSLKAYFDFFEKSVYLYRLPKKWDGRFWVQKRRFDLYAHYAQIARMLIGNIWYSNSALHKSESGKLLTFPKNWV